MEAEKMVGLPAAVVGGTEGGPGPTGVPTTTAVAEAAGAGAPAPRPGSPVRPLRLRLGDRTGLEDQPTP